MQMKTKHPDHKPGMKKLQILEAGSGFAKMRVSCYFSIGETKNGFKAGAIFSFKNVVDFCHFRERAGFLLFPSRLTEESQLDAQFWRQLVIPGPKRARPQPQNWKVSLLCLISGVVYFTRMELIRDLVGIAEARESGQEIW